jgi:uncharacterized SAM-binding protein YcdF (DUF218 family)
MLFLSKILGPAVSPVVIICALVAITILTIRRRPRFARGAAIAALCLLLLASNQRFSSLLTSYLETRHLPAGPLPDAQAIVVLSSDVRPAVPPQPAISLDGASANRLLYAAQLYRERDAPLVIVSGGELPWFKHIAPMSQGMADVIERMGVPRSAIIQEGASANTYENAVDVAAIVKARHIDRVLLVTSAMHMPRALALFKHQGIEAIPAPCDFTSFAPEAGASTMSWQAAAISLVPNADSLGATTMAVKEFLGIAVYHAAGLL